MNISSITNSWFKTSSFNSQDSSSANAFDLNVQPQDDNEQKRKGLDGNSAQALFSGVMSQGLLPIGDHSDSSSSDSSTASTVTSATDSSTSSSLSLADFLAKVKNGTVTDSDLSTLQSELNSMSEQTGAPLMPPPPPMTANSDSNSSSNSQSSSAMTQQLMMAAQAYENTSVVPNSTVSHSNMNQDLTI